MLLILVTCEDLHPEVPHAARRRRDGRARHVHERHREGLLHGDDAAEGRARVAAARVAADDLV